MSSFDPPIRAALRGLVEAIEGIELEGVPEVDAALANAHAALATNDSYRLCLTHGQQPPNAWGCPECLREMRNLRKGRPAAWLWEYVGSDPYAKERSPIARTPQEMDPSRPPYRDWTPLSPLYGSSFIIQ